MHRMLYRAAREDGRRVFLEGMGGDAVVSHGTGYLHDLAKQGRWLALGGEAHRLSQSFGRPTWRILRTVALSVAAPPVRRAWPTAQRRGLVGRTLIGADFARRVDVNERLRAAESAWLGGGAQGARREHWRLLTSARFAAMLEALAAAAGATGIDTRDPFLDRRLMEFCLALPASQKIRHGQTRVVARHALAALLPPAIRDR